MDILLRILAKTLTFMFVVGGIGCAIVIPLVAFRLFAVLLEKDQEDETNGKYVPQS